MLVELAEPTPFSKSPGTHSLSSWIVEACSAPILSESPPLGSAALSLGTLGNEAGRAEAKVGLDSPIKGDLGLLRDWAALDRFSWSTDGAVGKKSAKPLDERDMLKTLLPMTFGMHHVVVYSP